MGRLNDEDISELPLQHKNKKHRFRTWNIIFLLNVNIFASNAFGCFTCNHLLYCPSCYYCHVTTICSHHCVCSNSMDKWKFSVVVVDQSVDHSSSAYDLYRCIVRYPLVVVSLPSLPLQSYTYNETMFIIRLDFSYLARSCPTQSILHWSYVFAKNYLQQVQ